MKTAQVFSNRPLIFNRRLNQPNLMLTSLIDTFAIILIYLLINFANPELTNPLPQNMQLPMASNTTQALGTKVLTKDHRYFVNGHEVPQNELENYFKKGLTKNLLIEAEQHSSFSVLSPIINAAGKAGIINLRFAVMTQGE